MDQHYIRAVGDILLVTMRGCGCLFIRKVVKVCDGHGATGLWCPSCVESCYRYIEPELSDRANNPYIVILQCFTKDCCHTDDE
jgi:hypothetical protein